jgi:hypothetical protein
MSPDGVRYLLMAEGNRLSRPFYLRWLWPYICKSSTFRWRMFADICTTLMIPAAMFMLWCSGASIQASILGGLSVFGLSGVYAFNRRLPVLVDAPAMLVSTLAISFGLLGGNFTILAVILSLLAGCIKETSPIFSAIASFNPFLLVGLLSPILAKILLKEGKDPSPEYQSTAIERPFNFARQFHDGRWDNFRLMVAPWGGLILAILNPSIPLLLSLICSYSLLLVASDRVRIYQWAWHSVLISCFSGTPEWIWGPAALLTIFNPYKSGGD